ncbi:MAG: FAD-dependent oxidoreductase [Chitinophagia bacterium]|nr:FAD-dependent oxidoreductase [Chitinophagia bacterium]
MPSRYIRNYRHLHSTMKKYDVVIVGAGPAGCMAALALRNSNLKVALVDKAIFPRDKVCGESLHLKGINALRNFGQE